LRDPGSPTNRLRQAIAPLLSKSLMIGCNSCQPSELPAHDAHAALSAGPNALSALAPRSRRTFAMTGAGDVGLRARMHITKVQCCWAPPRRCASVRLTFPPAQQNRGHRRSHSCLAPSVENGPSPSCHRHLNGSIPQLRDPTKQRQGHLEFLDSLPPQPSMLSLRSAYPQPSPLPASPFYTIPSPRPPP
jgi:hypothetical protein